jgi:hypothetical protein
MRHSARADVLATRKVTFDDLVPGGRALIVGESFPYRRHQLRWWEAANRILQADGCVTRGSWGRNRVIGVTPALLATAISRALVGRVASLHGGGPLGPRVEWDEALVELRKSGGQQHDWTEYTLYWCAAPVPAFPHKPPCQRRRDQGRTGVDLPARASRVHRRTQACLSGLADVLHTPQSSLRLYEESAFDWGAWQSWDASRAFHDESFVFTVIQSIGGVNPSWVDRQVRPYL